MRALFMPAIALMNRLHYKRKFMLLGVPVAVVVSMLLYSAIGVLSRDIEAARQELEGLHMLKPMNRMVQLMQQHRGLSAGVLSGNEGMQDRRAVKEREVTEAVALTEGALSAKVRDLPAWKGIREDWNDIRRQGLSWDAPENLRRHTAMIDKTLVFMADVADETQLTLDPMMDTYYFMDTVVSKMPAILESLGIARARGTAALTKKALPPQQHLELSMVAAQMATTLRAQNANLDKVWHYAPELRGALAAPAGDFSDGADQVLGRIRNDILGEKFATPADDYFSLATKVIDAGYGMMFETLIPQFEKQLESRMRSARHELHLNIAVAAAAVAIVVYLCFGFYYSVIDGVGILARGADSLAEGDLTTRFAMAGVDELHAAGRNFDNMVATFRKLIADIQGNARQLKASAEDLSTCSRQIAMSASAQSDSASSMAASVEQLTVGIDHIASNAQSAQNFSRESDEVANRGGRIVQGVLAEISSIADTINESSRTVHALGRNSDEISTIVGTIKDIADQTNLLALNAAIEAARAGDTGRGFAVVADEVRKLAERTAKSTQEIGSMIANIQAETSNAVSSMKQGVERVAQGVEQAQLAGGAIEQVQAQSRQVVGAVSEISNSLREQAAASTDIAQNVERIAQMAEENDAVAKNNAETANQLSRLATVLENAVVSFKT